MTLLRSHLGGRLAWLCLALVFGLGCGSDARPVAGQGERSDRLPVFVSILPQAFLTERIGGDRVDVQVLVGPGQSPATYEPTAKQLVALASTEVFFAIGVPFEEAVIPRLRQSFPRVRIVDSQEGIESRPVEDRWDPGASSAGPEQVHEGGGCPDPHVWLSPRQTRILAANTAEALAEIDPAHASEYRANLDSLADDLERVHREIETMLAPFRGRELYVYHPAFGYFTDEYGLIQVPIEAGGASPGPRYLSDFIERAEKRGAQAILVQSQFSTTTARTVAESIGARLVVVDPLARDYLNNLRAMAAAIRDGLGAEPEPSAERSGTADRGAP